MTDAQTKRLGQKCLTSAEAAVGPLWQHFSPELRWAFVAEQILSLLRAQDESISDARVRSMMNALTEYCTSLVFK